MNREELYTWQGEVMKRFTGLAGGKRLSRLIALFVLLSLQGQCQYEQPKTCGSEYITSTQ